jgi:hypothetical protein
MTRVVPCSYLFSIWSRHRLKTNRIHNGGSRPNDGAASDLESGKLNLPVALLSDGGISGGTTVQGGIESANGQLAAGLGELEGKDATGSLSLADESLEDRRCIVVADALEAHPHQAISGKVGTIQIVRRSRLQGRSMRLTSQIQNCTLWPILVMVSGVR